MTGGSPRSAEPSAPLSDSGGNPTPNPRNQAGYDEDQSVSVDNHGANVADQFLKRAYFTRLHKFGDEPEDHPLRGKVCFAADFLIRLIAALIILGIAFFSAWKSLSPLPWQ